MISVLISSLEETYIAESSKKLFDFYVSSDKNNYQITNNPELADIILICDVRLDNYMENIRKSILIKRFLNKCFILSDIDRPLPILHGILTSGEKSWLNFGRIRSCSYNAYCDTFQNPFIANHIYSKSETNQKKYLFSFIGRESDPVRKCIFNINYKREDIFLEDSSNSFNLYDQTFNFKNRQKQYYNIMLQSKFVLCPRGWGATSYRLFEALRLGIAPVIISDEWIFPKGPKWDDFSIIISRKDIGSLEKRIMEKESDFASMGVLARIAYEHYFDDSVIFDYIIRNCLEIKKKQVIPESIFFYIVSPLSMNLIKFKNGKIKSFADGFNSIISSPFDILKKSNLVKIKRFLGF